MGDPRKHRKNFSTPSHPWNKERIIEESEQVESYALKNKREIYKANSILKKYLKIAKRFATIRTKQDEIEKTQFLEKMRSFGFIDGDDVSKVLDLELKNILERRLQTLTHRKGFARSMKQSRQFITHRHIMVGDKKITMPSYLVTLSEEPKISFIASSNLSKDDHPERVILKKKEKPERKRVRRYSGPPGSRGPGRRVDRRTNRKN